MTGRAAARAGRYALSPHLPAIETELVEEVLRKLGLQRTRKPDWDLLWHDGSVLPDWTYASLGPRQRINHFPGVGELTFKQRLAANLADVRMDGNPVIPRTYCLPVQRDELLRDLDNSPAARWLLKPANTSAGSGIRLLADPRDLPARGVWLVQEYVADPYLWRGRKFHLRLFMLVTGLAPPVIYLYREGQVLGASRPYRGADRDLDDPYVHLTNFDIQHRRGDVPDSEYVAGLPALADWMAGRGDDFDTVWRSIRGIVVKIMSIIGPKIRPITEAQVPGRWNCFGLFGLDVLLDSRLKPWLLECNLSPSLAFYAPDRRALYGRLVSDMFRLVGVGQESFPGPGDPVDAELARQLRSRGGFERLIPGAGGVAVQQE